MNSESPTIMKENFIPVFGGQIWSMIMFSENNKHLPPIICLHGGPGSDHGKLEWGFAPLAQKFPLIFYDQIGGGFSKNKLQQNVVKTKLWTIQNFVN